MSKLSRRDFLKAAAKLTGMGALAWVADASPVIGVDKAIEGGDKTEFALGTFDANGALHAQLIDGQVVEYDTGFVELAIDDSGVLHEQPFEPYYFDPYSSKVEVLFYNGNET